MNRRQKIIISVTGLFLVLLILVGLTYAYFLTKIIGNTNNKSISVSTANLVLTYSDGNGVLESGDKLSPGNRVNFIDENGDSVFEKTFTVTNSGDATDYVVILDNVNITKNGVATTFESNDFIYSLSCFSSDDNKCDDVDSVTLPLKNEGILIGNKIEAGVTHTYSLSMEYKETGVNQSADMGKTFTARINIDDIKNLNNPFNEGTLAYNLINNSISMKNGTLLVSTPPSKVGYEKNSDRWDYAEPILTEYDAENIVAASTNPNLTTSDYDECLYGVWDDEIGDYVGEGDCTGIETSNLTCENLIGKYFFDDVDWKIYGPVELCVGETPAYYAKYESVLSVSPDDYGTSYYYRGAVKDNYVRFAGFDWRIVRINGDGSVRLLLDGTLDKVKKDGVLVSSNSKLTAVDNDGILAYNTGYADNAYIGYMYGTPGSNNYNDTHKNVNSSKIKKYVDAFYEAYIENYDSYLADTLFCSDKTLASKGYQNLDSLGYGSFKSYYKIFERFYRTNDKDKFVTFECAKNATNTYSRYTSDSTKTVNGVKVNNDLTYPIGLMSADELIFAGTYLFENNPTNYLFNSYYYDEPMSSIAWFTMTPTYFNGDSNASQISPSFMYGIAWGYIAGDSIWKNGKYEEDGVRPVINLKPDLLITSGDGTRNNPYVVQ